MKTPHHNCIHFVSWFTFTCLVLTTVSFTAVDRCVGQQDDERSERVVRLRTPPRRDVGTIPSRAAVGNNANVELPQYRLSQLQEEYFQSTTARLRAARQSKSAQTDASPQQNLLPQLDGSGHYLEFLPDEEKPEGVAQRTALTFRDGELQNKIDNGFVPVPLGRHLRQKDPRYRHNKRRLTRSDEYVYDGSDREKRVQVDADWNIYGMDTEDTFGHFDTVDGKRLVSPSNRVQIYAPRFSAIRRVDNLSNAHYASQVNNFKRKEGLNMSRAADASSSTKQHVSVDVNELSLKASGFRDQTRGVLTDNVVQLRGSREAFQPYENFDLIRWGKHSKSETARLEAGMQAANVWQDNLGLQVFGKNLQPIIVNDTIALQQMVTVETDDDNAILRVTKVASKLAARPGEEVEFTIRFDNLSSRKIGNVTLVDNLTNRLQYIVGTAQCSIDAKFVQKNNSASSLTLRWEIDKPIAAGKGGVIRFKCRVR